MTETSDLLLMVNNVLMVVDCVLTGLVLWKMGKR